MVEPSKYYVENGIPALRSLNVKQGLINQNNLIQISEKANELLSKSKLQKGDLVTVRSGQPGTTSVVPDELDGCNCIDLIIIRNPPSDSNQYLCWYLASDIAVNQFGKGSGGAIQQHFNIGTAANIIVVRPPRDEQDTILHWLNRQMNAVDDLITEAQRAICLLKERRSALISAAVTGKIDVRDLAPKATGAA